VCAVDSLDRSTGPICEGPDAIKAVWLPHTRNAPGKAGRPPPARQSWTAGVSRPPTGPHSYDGAKRLQRRKRHPLVDTLGLVGKVQVTAADVGDRGPLSGLDTPAPGIASQVMQHHTADTSRAGCRRVPRHRSCRRSQWSRGGGGRANLAWLGRFRRLSRTTRSAASAGCCGGR